MLILLSAMEGFGLSSRGAANVAAIWPRISQAVEEREQRERPIIDMGTSENFLLRDELVEIYKKAVQDELCSRHFSYPNGLAGDQDLIDALARFFNEYFRPLVPVEKHHIATAPGVAFSLDALLYNICEAGDGILIPTPCWNGFDWLVTVRAGVQPIFASVDSLDAVFTATKVIESLELAIAQSSCPVRGLLLTNPHNPLGRCYPTETIESIIRFCDEMKIHFISDEIYAMSEFGRSDIMFLSALHLDIRGMGCDPSRVHVLWGLSKDLGSNGLRMGCCVTQANKPMVTGLALSSNTQLSSLTALVTTSLLNSPNLSQLFALNSKRLADAYVTLTTWLAKQGMPYIPAYIGCFVFTRVAPSAETWEDEMAVIQAWKNAGVSVSPGRSYHVPDAAKGWARINFALAPADLAEALRRLALVLDQSSEQNGELPIHDS
ncbi:1-aminocyclopropane-1-carboxylate synthase 7 [Xylariaceae sp. AK1471]|nr:1-aminocyclopropane-1-carboxylate synthase 7 [Xylariaceae sp. AK1471]